MTSRQNRFIFNPLTWTCLWLDPKVFEAKEARPCCQKSKRNLTLSHQVLFLKWAFLSLFYPSSCLSLCVQHVVACFFILHCSAPVEPSSWFISLSRERLLLLPCLTMASPFFQSLASTIMFTLASLVLPISQLFPPFPYMYIHSSAEKKRRRIKAKSLKLFFFQVQKWWKIDAPVDILRAHELFLSQTFALSKSMAYTHTQACHELLPSWPGFCSWGQRGNADDDDDWIEKERAEGCSSHHETHHRRSDPPCGAVVELQGR